MSKVFNFLWYKVHSTQISQSQVKNCDQQLETKKLLVLYKEKNRKMPIKNVKIKILKNKKMRFFLMSQGSLDPKIWFLGQKVCSVARGRMDTQTHTKLNTEDTLSGFSNCFSTYHQGSVQQTGRLIGKLVVRSTIVRGCASLLYNFQETICVLPHVLGVFWPS